MQNNNSNILEIKDIAISAYLIASGKVTFLGKRKTPNGNYVFKFSPIDDAHKLIDAYWNLTGPLIQAKKLFSAQRDLKDIIFGS